MKSSGSDQSWHNCVDRDLKPQLALFAQATIATLGGKAHERIRRLNVPHVAAGAAAPPPGCNQRRVRESWARIAEAVRARDRGFLIGRERVRNKVAVIGVRSRQWAT